jgi:hypothetical protein
VETVHKNWIPEFCNYYLVVLVAQLWFESLKECCLDAFFPKVLLTSIPRPTPSEPFSALQKLLILLILLFIYLWHI